MILSENHYGSNKKEKCRFEKVHVCKQEDIYRRFDATWKSACVLTGIYGRFDATFHHRDEINTDDADTDLIIL